ncbi:probable galacturonosyltransferase 6 isoform X3 [Phoenix dactylifera]|uniref:Hexosyltransferase n=1 Tax=Phoenix dactylifera TaxID=42345 RepID=A0A8B7CYT5_PHODC|nr:probable galacturonosyltransferase 6 isoform X3 [Phoenix dactylifera]
MRNADRSAPPPFFFTMRISLRRPRNLFLALLCLSCVLFLVPPVLLSNFPTDLSAARYAARKEFIGDFSGIVKNFSLGHPSDALTLKQETDGGVKEPTGIVYKERDYRDPVNSRNTTIHNTNLDEANGLQFGNGGGGERKQENANDSTGGKKPGPSNCTTAGEHNEGACPQPVTSNKIWQMEDQLIMAKAFLQFAPPSSNSHLVRELKQRIKEIERVLSQAKKDSDLSRSSLQKIKAMEVTLSKAEKSYPDCSAVASKLRAMTYNTEEQLRAQQKQASYFIQLAGRTLPKGLHCLSMRLTTEYFTMQPEERELLNRHDVQKPNLYHYAIFSDNILACTVVVNSTVSKSKEPEKIVFHVVTDSLNFPAMVMWFSLNPPGQATIQIQNLDDFKWLPASFSSMFKQPGVDDLRYTSALNHLRFYLPEIFPSLDKVLLLDHDVVVQRDLRGLWSINMKGKINGAVETCREGEAFNRLEMLVNFSDPVIASSFDAKACLWAFGMNMFDLKEWRRRGLSRIYHNWLQVGKRQQLWKAGSLPLGQLIFYNQTVPLDRWWHVLGFGHDSSISRREVDKAAVIHYDGNMKPWLEIAIDKYRGYWNKFLDYNNPYFQQCNIHT